ncbi:tripartite tricarboxylate transporter substrate-binding protein [Paracoccus sp. (in: a-proteobacteria)]|uniref:tripartite tricarboxylate transporter substrate-binding protein n=1 Tax=Paracoccus sp. TaxID=267 RepID=UPI0026DF5484|nr:tripartite tricarboxylate transporter substrate-binding protein [Paracoccus sp. (in: a-proteobacteria)]MDO5648294.1 tripartite tricarboxylate transporter substrate-binding protein [Paracoccus sp. (in: a-proteobacteria)]
MTMPMGSLNRRQMMALLAAALPARAIGAQDVPVVDFTGQRIEWIIPFNEGGGSDVWARFMAPLIHRYLPGQPEIVLRNETGGSGTRGANLFASRARSDGTMVLGTSGSTQITYLLRDFRVRFHFDDWDVLMATPTGGAVYIAPELGVRSWRDAAQLQGQRLRYASMGPASLDLVPMLAFRMLGFDVRYIFGYTGRSDGLNAMQQGAANIDHQTTAAYLANVVPQIAAGRAVPLFSWGVLDAQGQEQRDPSFPDLPTFAELYERIHGAPPSGPDYDALRVFATAGFAAQKLLVVPRTTPAAIQTAWTDAISAALRDPIYQALAAERLGAYDTLVGRDAAMLARQATHIDPALRKHVLDILARDYSVRMSD